MKKVVIFIAITIIIISACSVTLAATINPETFKPSQVFVDNAKVMEKGQKILGIINTVGVIVLIATIAILGIIYMAGSVEQRADYKGRMIPIIIGAVLLFGLSTIINFVYTVVTK